MSGEAEALSIRAAAEGTDRDAMRPRNDESEGNGETAVDDVVAELSARFVHVSAEGIGGAIDTALARTGRALGLDYCLLARAVDDAKGLELAHSYATPGLEPFPVTASCTCEEIGSGGPCAIADVGQAPCPHEDRAEKELLLRLGVRSSLTIPLHLAGRPVGVARFMTVGRHSSWPDKVVAGLTLIAHILTNALSRQQSELALERSEERMRLAADSANVGLWSWDVRNDSIWASERAYALYGIPVGDRLTFSRFLATVHAEDRSTVEDAVARCLREGVRYRAQYRVLHPGGQMRWISAIGASSRNAAGEAERLTGASIDVTEERDREEILRRDEALLRLASDYLPVVIALFGPDERYRWVSREYERVLKIPQAQIVGLTFRELLGEDRYAGNKAVFDRVMFGETVNLSLSSPDGSRQYEGTGVPAFGPDGRIEGALLAAMNVTELRRALEENRALRERLERENVYLREEVDVLKGHGKIVGQSPAMQRVLVQVEQVAPTPATVLLTGETGTGKELIASAIHDRSPRHERPLVRVNCAAIPLALVESELFGREKGAYTGALSRQAGRFELAHGSTIFLDEVGELPLEAQAKLLRVLQEREIERLGSPKLIKVDVRVIAATNRDLAKLVAEGRFREDLFFRLNVFPIVVPPLRERREDIPVLVTALVREIAPIMGKHIDAVAKSSLQALDRYDWPGNVRELRNVIERAVILATGPTLTLEPPAAASPTASAGLPTLADAEREHILRALERAAWRVRGRGGAAEHLGLKPTTLEARMMRLGIQRPQPKRSA